MQKVIFQPIPKGAILLWYGTIATIPSGWALCNGANGTPDLRNKFTVCADADDAGVAKSIITGSALQTGGSITVDIWLNDKTGTIINDASASRTRFRTNTADEEARDATVSTIPAVGKRETIINPFYALAYIMKL